jgi:hypothetical protein
MTATATKRPRGKPRRADGVSRGRAWHADDALYGAAEALAAREGLSMSALVYEAVQARLARPSWKRIAMRLLADASVRARLESVPAVEFVGIDESRETTMLARIEAMVASDLTPSMWRSVVERIERHTAEL